MTLSALIVFLSLPHGVELFSTGVRRSQSIALQLGKRHGEARTRSGMLLPCPWSQCHARRRSQRLSAVGFDPETAVYNLQLWTGDYVKDQLVHISPVSVAIIYGAGLLSALSPCGMSLLPFTVAYLSTEARAAAGPRAPPRTMELEEQPSDADDNDGGNVVDVVGGEGDGGRLVVALSLAFAAGSATTLATLGVAATLLGQVWGSLGGGGPVGGAISSFAAAAFAIACGLNLLGLVEFDLPSLAPPPDGAPGEGGGAEEAGLSPGMPSVARGSMRSFAFGASSALVSSPCSTPVLASLLGFVASSSSSNTGGAGSYALGLALLLVYTAGYTTPVVAAGALGAAATTDAAKAGGRYSEAVTTPLLAGVLIAYGVYSGLDAAFPQQGTLAAVGAVATSATSGVLL